MHELAKRESRIEIETARLQCAGNPGHEDPGGTTWGAGRTSRQGYLEGESSSLPEARVWPPAGTGGHRSRPQAAPASGPVAFLRPLAREEQCFDLRQRQRPGCLCSEGYRALAERQQIAICA